MILRISRAGRSKPQQANSDGIHFLGDRQECLTTRRQGLVLQVSIHRVPNLVLVILVMLPEWFLNLLQTVIVD